MRLLKRVNYLGSFTTLFILTGISFSVLLLLVLYIEFLDFQYKSDIDKAKHETKLKQEKIYNFYNRYEKFLSIVEHNKFFVNFLENPTKENKEDLITLFITLSENEKAITQLRYLDKNGNEVVRVDRDQPGENIFLVLPDKLQNKRHRDYFQKTIKKSQGEVFVSKLNLNIEHNQIEMPYKPVWRFAMPVFFGGERKGIIIINVFGQYLLNDIVQSNSFNITIFDQDGEVLVSSDKTKNQWTRYLHTKPNLDKKKFIFNSLLIEEANKETLYIALTQKDWLNNFFRVINLNVLFLFIFIVSISFVLAYFLAKIPKKLFDELEINQKMLIQQSKVAAMGEMTSMLAHQWRQPLNTISVLFQEIEIKRSMSILSDEEFQMLSEKIKSTLLHMSETIDNFRDFFKPKKGKNKFNLIQVIHDAYNILEMKLNKNDIFYEVIISPEILEEELIFDSYEGEFKQVLVSIINNAIEAIELQTQKKEYFIKTYIKHDDDNYILSIEDNAGGIKAEILENIFQPYLSTKFEQNGTGLGLYMSKMIVENSLHGKLTAHNIKEGASFVIEIKK